MNGKLTAVTLLFKNINTNVTLILVKSILKMTEMTTGDLKGCLRKLEASLRSLKYPREVDYQRYEMWWMLKEIWWMLKE